MASLENCLPRDLSMYKQTELFTNIHLENTREQRERELDRMRRLRKQTGSYVGAAKSIMKLISEED